MFSDDVDWSSQRGSELFGPWPPRGRNVLNASAGMRTRVRKPPGCTWGNEPSSIRRRTVEMERLERLANSSTLIKSACVESGARAWWKTEASDSREFSRSPLLSPFAEMRARYFSGPFGGWPKSNGDRGLQVDFWDRALDAEALIRAIFKTDRRRGFRQDGMEANSGSNVYSFLPPLTGSITRFRMYATSPASAAVSSSSSSMICSSFQPLTTRASISMSKSVVSISSEVRQPP